MPALPTAIIKMESRRIPGSPPMERVTVVVDGKEVAELLCISAEIKMVASDRPHLALLLPIGRSAEVKLNLPGQGEW